MTDVISRSAALRSAGRRAAGAVSGQLSQALGSFVLQVLAARALGAEGLGKFAVLYGAIVVATAVTTGMVGDSLTVLDRGDPATRVALVRWCLGLSASAGLVAATVAAGTGALSTNAAVLFGLATVVFLIEDALRRLLMASFRFWSLPAVDGAGLLGSVLTLGLARAAGYRPTIALFLLALFVGQSLAAGLAILRLPAHERFFPVTGPAAMRSVFGYGAWRSVQLSLRPATLTAARLVITLVVGLEAYGQLEAARVYMAPALLLVSGMGSFLLPTYVAERDQPLDVARRRADRAAAALLAATLAGGVGGTLAAPLLGPIITGGDYDLQPIAVLGWAVYAASSAALLPYTGLAAVRGRQRVVTGVRLFDPLLSLALVAPAAAIGVAASPYALAVGSFLAGLVIRAWVLRPQVADGSSSAGGRSAEPPTRREAPVERSVREGIAE